MEDRIRLPPPSETWMTDTVPSHQHALGIKADTTTPTHAWTEEDLIYFMYTRYPKVLVRHKDCVKRVDLMALFILYALGGVFVKSGENCEVPATFSPGKVTVRQGFIASPKRHPLLEKVLRAVLDDDEEPMKALGMLSEDCIE